MEVVRNPDGSLIIQVEPSRRHGDDADTTAADDTTVEPTSTTTPTRVIHPGEGGYDEALAEWDLQQDPDRGPAVSTASGREQAMTVVHDVAEDPQHDVAGAVEGRDAEPVAEALRHVLVGGEPSVSAFADEVADAEGGEPLPAHELTKVIGEVIAEIDEG